MKSRREKRRVLRGLAASPGQVIGPAYLHVSRETQVPSQRVAPDEIAAEIRRFRDSLRKAREEIRELRERLEQGSDDPGDQILAAHLMILQDRELIREITAAIKAERMNAADVVRRTFLAKTHYIESLPSEVFRGRAADIRDVQRRLLVHLLEEKHASLAQVPEGSIVVARELVPSETVSLGPGRLAGVVTEQGTLTSHVTILARSRGVPAVIGVDDALADISHGETILVDGDHGVVIVAPNDDDIGHQRESIERVRRIGALVAGREQEAGATQDGHPVPVRANIERPEDGATALQAGAEGVGLFRTEFLFLDGGGLPGEERQWEAYRQVAEVFAAAPVTIRTLDLGGDKHASLMGIAREENPFLGLRGIRFCLEQPDLFLPQVRAILRAASGGNLRMLLPMVGSVAQLRATRELVARATRELRAEGHTLPAQVPVGVMIEVPAAVLMSDALAREADFFSIGSNDLIQYSLAVDRGNARIARLYDALDPAILRAIEMTVRHAHAAGIRVGSCGEMSGELPGMLLLVGLGIDELSVAPVLVARTKAILGGIDFATLQRLARRCLEAVGADEVAQVLTEGLAHHRQFHFEQLDGRLRGHWDPDD